MHRIQTSFAPFQTLFPAILVSLSLAACGGDSGGPGVEVFEPTELTYNFADATFETCEAVSDTPNSDGSPLSFSIAPPLPAGLVLDGDTGEISGNPSEVTPDTSYTITATNILGEVEATINFEVVDAPDPANLAYSQPNVTYEVGTPIIPNSVTFDGNLGAFEIDPALPTGLELSMLTGAITGTPTAAATSTTFEVTGTNCEGQSTQALVTITVDEGADPGPGPGPGPGAGDEPRFAFVANAGDDTISILAFDGLTGRTEHFGFSPIVGTPTSLAISADQNTLFVGTDEGSLSVFSIDSAFGVLTEQDQSPVFAGDSGGSIELLLNSAGDVLYVANSVSNDIAAFAVANNGELADIAGSPFALSGAGSAPAALALSPDEDFLFVANFGTDSISSFQVDASGSLLSEQVFSTDDEPASLDTLTSENGSDVLYVGTQAGQTLVAFTVDSAGGLAPLGASLNVGGPLNFVEAMFLPNNGQRVLLAGNAGMGLISRHGLVATGQPTVPIGEIDEWVGLNPTAFASVPDQDFGLVTFSGESTVSSAELDPTDFADITVLEPTDRLRTRGMPVDVVIATGGASGTLTSSNLYATNFNSADISQFAFDSAGTSLAALAPATEAAGTNPEAIALHPRLPRAYVVDATDPDSILVFDVATGGQFTGPPTMVTVTGDGIVDDLAVDPSGRFLFAVRSAASSELLVYPIDASGDLGVASGSPLGSVARGLVIDPTGRFVYATNFSDENLQSFSIAPVTGALTPIDTTTTGIGPESLAIDPAGIALYVANRGDNSISQFAIDVDDGSLTMLADPVSLGAGSAPTALHVHRVGRQLYAAAEGSSELIQLNINVSETDMTEDGTLIPFPAVTATAGMPVDIDGNAQGTAILLTLADTGEVLVFTVVPDGDPSSLPTLVQTAAAGGAGGSTRRLAIRDEL